MNSTVCSSLLGPYGLCSSSNLPFYYSQKPTIIQGVPDSVLSVAAPLVAYWSLSLFFHFLDTSGWKWLEKHRIHESSEVQSRNRATRSEVVWAVLLQQFIQTILGLLWMSDEGHAGESHAEKMRGIADVLAPAIKLVLGNELGSFVLETQGAQMVYFVYWWGIPTAQFLFAAFFLDTWQYFLHRWMHVNKFLYKHVHSVHHRLYVPYAFGSLYNHPFEGFLLDSLGAVVAEAVSGMTTRQAILLFSISTLKTVDDHCGYRLPFDPLQMITSNNADYHDIHHQIIGIKHNFSQPFFVHWDTLLGTRMTRKDVELKKKLQKEKST